MLEDAGRRRKRYIAWHDDAGAPPTRRSRTVIERGDPADLVPPAAAGRAIDPHLGHDGHAEGRVALAAAQSSTRWPRCSRSSRCARARTR